MGSQWEAQRLHYEAHFPRSDHRLIRLDGEPIGRIWVDDSDDETFVLDMALLPEHRSRGIATLLLGELMRAAEPLSKTVKLSVSVLNPRPISLLERLGFERVDEEAPFPNVYLIRRPASAVQDVMMGEATTAA